MWYERDSGRPHSSQAVGTKRRRSDKAMTCNCLPAESTEEWTEVCPFCASPPVLPETPGGNGRWGRPCSSSPGCFFANWHLAAAHHGGPVVTFRPMGRFGPATRICGFRSKYHFRAGRCTVQIRHFQFSGLGSVACQGCVHAERERQRKTA